MPKPKKSKAAREREAIHKKKIRQLERDIKIMQKDLRQTFEEAEMKEPPKKRHLFPVVCASVMGVCVLILAAIYIYVNFFMM